MQKYILFAATILIYSSAAQALTVNFHCSDANQEATPYLLFDIKVDRSSETAEIWAASLPFSTAEIMVAMQKIETCGFVKVSKHRNPEIEINCGNEDGEGGRSSLRFQKELGTATGKISFPNGFKVGETFIDEESARYELNCVTGIKRESP